MKANRKGMQPVALATLRIGAPCPFALYLFLPRNQRMVLIRRAGDRFEEELYRDLANRPALGLWREEPEILADRIRQAKDSGEWENLATELRDQVHSAVQSHALVDDALLQEVLRFRCDQPANAHSVIVGTLSGTLAMENGAKDPAFLSQLLIAATFHDGAYSEGEQSHAAAILPILSESEFSLPEPVIDAIQRHHNSPDTDPHSVQRYLSLAEAMAAEVS